MNVSNIGQSNPYLSAYENNMAKAYEKIANTHGSENSSTNKNASAVALDNASENNSMNKTAAETALNNAAVNVSISMESIRVYLNIKTVEVTQDNTKAQSLIDSLETKGEEIFKFLNGEDAFEGLNLKSIGYEGKAITQLSKEEASELISDEGFFGVTATSDRVSSFVFGIALDDVEALEESRKGIVQGFEEAEKLWGEELPAISYATQERTLEIIDARIAQAKEKDEV